MLIIQAQLSRGSDLNGSAIQVVNLANQLDACIDLQILRGNVLVMPGDHPYNIWQKMRALSSSAMQHGGEI